jgi:hypothetical protein
VLAVKVTFVRNLKTRQYRASFAEDPASNIIVKKIGRPVVL